MEVRKKPCGDQPLQQRAKCLPSSRRGRMPLRGSCRCTAPANPACAVPLKQYAQHLGSAFLISGFHTIANNELPDGKWKECAVWPSVAEAEWTWGNPVTDRQAHRLGGAKMLALPEPLKVEENYSSVWTAGFPWGCEEEEHNLNTIRQDHESKIRISFCKVVGNLCLCAFACVLETPKTHLYIKKRGKN